MLHTNQRLLVEELTKRGAHLVMIDKDDELMEVTYKDKKEFLLDRFSSKAPFHMVKVSADKHLAKQMMQRVGIKTPTGHVFTSKNVDEALNYANTIYPVVLKPNWGSHGDHIQVDLRNPQELEIAIWQFIATQSEEPFIIERYHPWKEYRLFTTSIGGFAVVHREPASVIGNGQNTIEELANIESERRIELKKNQPTSLCPIVLDKEVNRCLIKKGLSIQYIPSKNEKLFLRYQSNLAKGGMAIDMTEEIDPSVKEIAFKALSAFAGLPCVGLDLLCADVTSHLGEDYVILEANSSPGLAMHTYPSVGISRNVAALIADVMFPDFFD